MKVFCPYCDCEAHLTKGAVLYGSHTSVADQNFWVCWPCDAYVGCHKGSAKGWEDGTKPLGTPAKRDLRKARSALHDKFDRMWEKGRMRRVDAYRWLALRLGIPKKSVISECSIWRHAKEQAICSETYWRCLMGREVPMAPKEISARLKELDKKRKALDEKREKIDRNIVALMGEMDEQIKGLRELVKTN